ncbi:MAG: aminoacyl-histidine dipeptidase [Flavobacteriaceae bacterium]
MNTTHAISALSPKAVWTSFVALNAVPRPSKKEEKIRAFMIHFGESLGLETQTDTIGNVLIKKAASPGMEMAPVVCLQSHLDMVHQKNEGTVFDFETQGIDMQLHGDWVCAKGTTLGADNGLGVAAIMAVLQATDISHGPIEALFTIDEETGMTGAKELRPNWLQAKYLLNLDTEDDDEIAIGCAGGIDITAKASFQGAALAPPMVSYQLKLSGLQGGHSGMDIHKGFGNANLIANKLLTSMCSRFEIQLQYIKGGSLRNAIPRESELIFALPKEQMASFEAYSAVQIHECIKNWSAAEPAISFEMKQTDAASLRALSQQDTKAICAQIKAVHNGVYTMSSTVPDLVETSNNLAKISLEDGLLQIECLCRSSVEKAKLDLAYSIKDCFDPAVYEVHLSGDYPGWEPRPEGVLLPLLKKNYENLFQESPRVVACHAGLECGLLGKPYPEMEMISFGPNIRGAHSPDEKVSVSSVQKFWMFFKSVLASLTH